MISVFKVRNMDESVIFQYADVFLAFLQNNDSILSYKNANHCLKYVYSGGMDVIDDGRRICVSAGEAVFIRRNHRVQITKHPERGEQFRGVTLVFNPAFLRSVYEEERQESGTLPEVRVGFRNSVYRIPQDSRIQSLFESLTPFFRDPSAFNDRLAKMKMREGVFALLELDNRFFPVLFDFADPWRVDLLTFMEANYACDLSIREFAHYTGRSLATFKRDFSKISDLPPLKWLTEKRLLKARELLGESFDMKVEDVCAAVGFRNRTHFATLFKNRFGMPPSKVRSMAEAAAEVGRQHGLKAVSLR